MLNFEITQAELNKLAWLEYLKKQEKVDEKKEYNKVLRKREQMILNSLEKVRNEPSYTFINHLSSFIKNSDITEAIKEAEAEWGQYLIR